MDESEGWSDPVDVMVPLVMVAVRSPGELSGLWLGEMVERAREELLRDTIFRFRSSRSRLFSGETLIKEERLLEVAVCICTLPEEGDVEVLRFTGPFVEFCRTFS